MGDTSSVLNSLPEFRSGVMSAQTGTRLIKMLGNISGHNGVRVEVKDGKFIRIYGTGDDANRWAFGVRMVGKNTVRIYAGYITYENNASLIEDVADSGYTDLDLTVTTSTGFIWLRFLRDNPASYNFGHTTAYPAPSKDSEFLVLQAYSYDSDSEVYSLTIIHHRGDFKLVNPLAKSDQL